MPSGPQIPKNSVWAGGMPREFCTTTYLVGTVAGIRPGRAVRLTAGGKLEVAPADSVSIIGWCSERNWSNPEWDGASNVAVDNELEVVLALPGVLVRGRTAADLSGPADQGKKVKLAANGTLALLPGTPAAADATHLVGRLIVGADGSGTEADVLVAVI